MYRKAALLAAGAALASVALVATGNPLSAPVTVKVRLLRSSGVCGAVAGAPGVEVSCVRPGGQPLPGGPLLPDAGVVPYRRVGTIRALDVASEPLPLYSDGTKITSWRVVTLDNARYVELTIAW